MSATIHSAIVDLDEIIPRPLDIKREEEDVEKLIPSAFRYADTVPEDYVDDSPQEEYEYRSLFDDLFSYCTELKDRGAVEECEPGDDIGVSGALKASEIITLPKKSWDLSGREDFRHFIRAQSMMLRALTKIVYNRIEGLKDTRIHFPIAAFKLKYVIGCEQFITKLEGAVTVGPKEKFLPIISHTVWFGGQTWGEFLQETLSVMLGQLAKNISIRSDGLGLQDQEVFVIGFHGLYVHIARGLFTTDMISRVHSEGCSENEIFELKFTRSYKLFLKADWLGAMRALVRLFRYLRSGNAQVSAIQAYLQDVVDSR